MIETLIEYKGYHSHGFQPLFTFDQQVGGSNACNVNLKIWKSEAKNEWII